MANCQAADVPGLRQPAGTQALELDKGLYLPESWISDQDRSCERFGCQPEERLSYRPRTIGVGLGFCWKRALGLGHLKAGCG